MKAERSERIILEESPHSESKSNGVAENAVQQVQGQFRNMRDGLESRLGDRIQEDSPLTPWLIAHAARTINRFQIGPDGRTNYRRWKGKDFQGEITEFGETILYLKAGTKGQDKYNPRWER